MENKQQIINDILALNSMTTEKFLNQFSKRDLESYYIRLHNASKGFSSPNVPTDDQITDAINSR